MDSLELSKNVRKDILRIITKAKASHVASALSCTDIISVLYSDVLRYNINNPKWENRDRFILSKGHAGSTLYSVLYEVGFINKDLLDSYYENGSLLSGHISEHGVNGVEFSTGSLGHGLSVAVGMALALKLNNSKSRVFVVLGDGECNEGAGWESLAFASQHNLDNLTIIVDHNKLQALGDTKNILDLDLVNIFKSFKANVYEVDGHNHEQLLEVFNKENENFPKVIIANTIKGKGVSFMENKLLWHYRNPSEEDCIKAIEEIDNA